MLFFSCDSLWQIDSKVADVAVNLNSSDILGQPNFSIMMSEYEGESESEPSLPAIPTIATVSLYDAKSDKLIGSQIVTFSNIDTASATFEKIKIGTTVYATIEIFGENKMSFGGYDFYMDPTLFKARSENTKIKATNNNLVTRPNAVYLQPSTGDVTSGLPVGIDENSGLNPYEPVETFDKALEILKHNGTLLPDATIYLKGTLSSESYESKTLDGEGVILKKFVEFDASIGTHNMISVESDLTLKNITIDGNKKWLSTRDDYTDSLVNVSGSTLTLDSGTILQNNNGGTTGAIYISDGNVTINDGAVIQNNHGSTAGGIYVGAGGTLNMVGGNIIKNTSTGENSSAGVSIEGGTVTLSGGNITQNSSTGTNSVGGIYVGDMENNEGTPLKLSGNPVVSGNIANGVDSNVVFDASDDSTPVLVVDDIDPSAKIGLNPNNLTHGTKLVEIQDDVVVSTSNFFLPNGSTIVKEEATEGDNLNSLVVGKLVVTEVYVGGEDANDENHGVTADSPVKTFAKAKSLLTSGSGTIWVMGTLEHTATSEENADDVDIYSAEPGKTIVLKRHSFNSSALINVGGGTLTLENITLDGQCGVHIASFEGEGTVSSTDSLIKVEGGNLIIEEGTVLQNNNTNVSGSSGGGAIYIGDADSSVTMKGGAIQYNTTDRTYGGGGISVVTGSFILENGLIAYNSDAYCGGGVYVGGNFTMLDGEIRSNESLEKGGGLYLNGSVKLEGGKITDNMASVDGGGVYLNGSDVTVTLKNAPIIKGNTSNNEPSNISYDIVDYDGTPTYPVIVSGLLNGSTNSIGLSPSRVYDNGKIPVVTGDTLVTGVDGEDGYDVTSDDVKKFFLDNGNNLEFNLEENSIIAADIPVTNVYVGNSSSGSGLAPNDTTDDLQVAIDSLDESGGTIWVMETLELDTEGSFNGGDKEVAMKRFNNESTALINVMMNGTLTLENITLEGNDNATEPLVKVDGGDLVLNDGAILQNNTNIQSGDGGAIYIASGNVIINDGAIIQNNDGINGGAINIGQSGSLEMNAGAIIQNNEASGNGGGGVYNGGTFTMNGGFIRDNTATTGGAIHLNNASGAFKLNGGEIINNSAQFGGGINITSSQLEISGAPIVKDNKIIDGDGIVIVDNNIAFTSSVDTSPISVTGDLTGNPGDIGLAPSVRGNTITVVETSTDYTDIFVLDNKTDEESLYFESGKIKIESPNTVKGTFLLSGNVTDATIFDEDNRILTIGDDNLSVRNVDPSSPTSDIITVADSVTSLSLAGVNIKPLVSDSSVAGKSALSLKGKTVLTIVGTNILNGGDGGDGIKNNEAKKAGGAGGHSIDATIIIATFAGQGTLTGIGGNGGDGNNFTTNTSSSDWKVAGGGGIGGKGYGYNGGNGIGGNGGIGGPGYSNICYSNFGGAGGAGFAFGLGSIGIGGNGGVGGNGTSGGAHATAGGSGGDGYGYNGAKAQGGKGASRGTTYSGQAPLINPDGSEYIDDVLQP